MPVAKFKSTVEIGGITISNKIVTVTASGQGGQEVTLNAAKSGTLSTRTDDNTGTLTLGSGHGIATSDVVDLYWTGGRRYGVTVGTVSGTSVPIDLGAGDNLPIATTVITVVKRNTVDLDVAFSTLGKGLAVMCDARGRCEFFDASNNLLLGLDLEADKPYQWHEDIGFSNPISAAIAYAKCSQATTSADRTMQIGFLYESAS